MAWYWWLFLILVGSGTILGGIAQAERDHKTLFGKDK